MSLNQDQHPDLPHLHDSTLVKVEVMWADSICRLHLIAWSESAGAQIPLIVELAGIRSVSVPRVEPWGPSSAVNTATFSAGSLNVEMQSGDLISISAESYCVLPSNNSLQARRP